MVRLVSGIASDYYSIMYIYFASPFAVIACIGGLIFKMIFNIVSRRVGERVRKAYFKALLANDATWHATQGNGAR